MEMVKVTSSNRNDAYTATLYFFESVKQLSLANINGWNLGEVYTSNSEQHFITTYTNGQMWVRAESIKGVHTYSFGVEK